MVFSQQRDQISLKGYGFLSFAKKLGKSVGKSISKNLSSNYSQRCLDHTKESATDLLKNFKKEHLKNYSKRWLVIKLQINNHKIPQRKLKVKHKYQRKIYNQKKTENYWWININITI